MLEPRIARHRRPTCSTSSRQVRRRWRMKLVLRGAVAVLVIGARRCSSLAAYGHGVGALQRRRRSSRRASSWRWPLLGVSLLVPGAAAAPPGHRRAGGALPRGARAVAAGDAAQRGRGQPQPDSARIGGAGAASRRAGDRARAQRRTPSRRVEQAPLRRYGAALGGVAVVAVLAVAARPGVPPQRAVGDAAGLGATSRRRRRTASR